LTFKHIRGKVHRPLSPQKEFQKQTKACKIIDLQAFSFLGSIQIIQKLESADILGFFGSADLLSCFHLLD
jgi:hypothetical protein